MIIIVTVKFRCSAARRICAAWTSVRKGGTEKATWRGEEGVSERRWEIDSIKVCVSGVRGGELGGVAAGTGSGGGNMMFDIHWYEDLM
jgi:hypothetical protein